MPQLLWVSFQDNETTVVEDCSERDSLFNLCYIIGSVSVGVSSFPFGVFFDRFGLRVGRIVARYVFQCLISLLISFFFVRNALLQIHYMLLLSLNILFFICNYIFC